MKKFLSSLFHKKNLAVLIILAISACSPLVYYRGYLPDEDKVTALEVGDNRMVVKQKLGSPSAYSTFEDNDWYYVSFVQEEWGFFKPEITKQKVLAIHFDENGQLTEKKEYGLEDGRVIAFNSDETPTHGKDLNAVQQILSNVGKFNTEQTGRSNGNILGGRPGTGGGF